MVLDIAYVLKAQDKDKATSLPLSAICVPDFWRKINISRSKDKGVQRPGRFEVQGRLGLIDTVPTAKANTPLARCFLITHGEPLSLIKRQPWAVYPARLWDGPEPLGVNCLCQEAVFTAARRVVCPAQHRRSDHVRWTLYSNTPVTSSPLCALAISQVSETAARFSRPF